MLQPDLLAHSGRFSLIALGSNVTSRHGDTATTVARAIEALAPLGLVAASRLFRTAAYPPGAGPDYVNAAAVLRTDLAPEALLARLHAIEADFDRARTARWASRTLDLDLIAMGALVRPDAETLRAWIELGPEAQQSATPGELILPHPRLADRAFVLVPLAEVAPDWRHPLTGLSVSEMLAARPAAERAEVVALG